MSYTDDELEWIYDRTSGYCHICHKKLSFSNYGALGEKGAWEVEHSHARANGGTDHGNNLYAACIPCNRDKGTYGTRTARSWNDKTCAPLSREKREREKTKNAVGTGLVLAAAGSVFGPAGMIIGGLLGAALGHKQNPDKKQDITWF